MEIKLRDLQNVLGLSVKLILVRDVKRFECATEYLDWLDESILNLPVDNIDSGRGNAITISLKGE